MPLNNRRPVIDADAHVIETEHTWDYMEPSEGKYRPLLQPHPDNPGKLCWVVDGEICGHRTGVLGETELRAMSERTGRSLATPQAARELDDVELRLKHMDDLGIDIQVMHNSLWIERVSSRPEVESALCRSWNRWLGEVWRKGGGRLRWTCVVPVVVMDEAIEQLKEAKENGAVAVCLRPLEGERHLTDQYFYPLYEAACDLDMAVAVHIANANPDNCDLYRSAPSGTLAIFRAPTVLSCYFVLMSELPTVFPKLRWGFIEASAQWVPWIHQEVVNRFRVAGRELPKDVFADSNVFVTCQVNDDLPFILRYSGDHSLVIGTDYGHNDPSSETNAIVRFKRLEGIGEDAREKILSENPARLYGL